MTNFSHLTALMPCRSLEDLNLQRPTDDAGQVLSAWSALWHPALVASAKVMPHWAAAEVPPEEPGGHLILLPPCAESLLPTDWVSQAEQCGGVVLRNLRSRDEMVAAALAQIEPASVTIDPELTADFLALGFCHFTIEMLTQHLRYMSNLDESSFERELVAAAEAVWSGDNETARSRLQAAFDLLHTAREYFYPVEAHLLDLTLVAPTTLGESLRTGLAGGPAANLLISGQVLDELARREPETLAVLRQALAAGTAALVGGEFCELELPLLPPEAIRYQLQKGLDAYQMQLGLRPVVFGRRRFGMTPVLPQILDHMGFTGAMHATLDDGRYPAGNQSRVRWEGLDGTVLETILRVPSDISRAEAFHQLPQFLGNSMDMDHVATVVFAHWPGRSSGWYRDLQRITGYTTVMGSFSTITDYFQTTGIAGQQSAYKADEYRSPYLRQAVAADRRDPISRWVRYFARRATAEAVQTLDTLTALVAGGQVRPDPAVLCEVDDSLEGETAGLDEQLQSKLDSAAAGFARSVTGSASPDQQGVLVANPSSFTRQMLLEMPELAALPDVGGAIQFAAESAGRKTVVVEVPPMGFAWIGPGAGGAAAKPVPQKWGLFRKAPAKATPLAELITEPTPAGAEPSKPGAVLRNDFTEVFVDPHTGALRAIHDYRSRGPRLAQQIAMRLPGATGDGDEGYSIMAADEILVTSPGPVLGEVVVRGRLMDREGHRIAGFQQTTRIWRGSRLIELEIELDVARTPEADPWNSYYAARFAWADETSNLYRGVNEANVPTDATQLESPHFIDVRTEKLRTTLLSGGLPYHRRVGTRRLDTLLVVRGETARRFRLAIGIDLQEPMVAALDFIAPKALQSGRAKPSTPSGWLFHVDVRNVVATHWEPIDQEGRTVGFRVRLLEVDGLRVALGLRSFRTVVSAKKVGLQDRPPVQLSIEGDRVRVDLGPYEWTEVEARFEPEPEGATPQPVVDDPIAESETTFEGE